MEIETINHLFWECNHVQLFWTNLTMFLLRHNITINFSLKYVIFRITEITNCIETKVKNYIILLGIDKMMESNIGTTRPANIKSGVPHGSILGPTLVLIFLNDLHPFMEHSNSDYYAGDATVHTHANTRACLPTEIEAKLQHDDNNIKLWCKQNSMEIDHDNTTCMLVGTQLRTKESILKH